MSTPYTAHDSTPVPASPPQPSAWQSMLGLVRNVLYALENLGGLIAAGLVYLDRRYGIIPVNEQTRQWGIVAAILAVVAGLGAHQSARRLREPSVGWGFFWFAVLDLVLLICLVTIHLPPPLRAATSAVPVLYALLFVLLGGAIGGFLL